MTLSDTHRRLLLWRSVPGFGLKGFALVYRHFGTLDALFGASCQALQVAGLRPALAEQLQRISDSRSEPADLPKIEQWAQGGDAHSLLHIDEPAFPALLREIHCPPPLLYVAGNLPALSRQSVAVIGARKASPLARNSAFTLSAELAAAGCCVVSGLALGIDAQAHEGALSVDGCSIAVMACGLDQCYPKRHADLAGRLQQNGALVSEMPPGTAPHPGLFPRRNRLVSGLCCGVVVVEASIKSGSLITASMALEQNRELMAIPGLVSNQQAKGCHFLIKQGAALVECAEDVLGQLGVSPVRAATDAGEANTASAEECVSLSDSERRIVALLSQVSAMDFDHLAYATELSVSVLNASLLGLELKGVIASAPGGYQLAKPVNLPA